MKNLSSKIITAFVMSFLANYLYLFVTYPKRLEHLFASGMAKCVDVNLCYSFFPALKFPIDVMTNRYPYFLFLPIVIPFVVILIFLFIIDLHKKNMVTRKI